MEDAAGLTDTLSVRDKVVAFVCMVFGLKLVAEVWMLVICHMEDMVLSDFIMVGITEHIITQLNMFSETIENCV